MDQLQRDTTLTQLKARVSTAADNYSDYTITCRDQTFKLQKIILHVHSEYFVRMLTGKFKEAQSNSSSYTVDHDPEEFKAMIDFFYGFGYDVPRGRSPLLFHVQIYELANFYEAVFCENYAQEIFKAAAEFDHPRPQVMKVIRKIETLSAIPAVDEEKGFRKLAMKQVVDQLSVYLKDEEFRVMTDELSGWAVDFISFLTAFLPFDAEPGSLNHWVEPEG